MRVSPANTASVTTPTPASPGVSVSDRLGDEEDRQHRRAQGDADEPAVAVPGPDPPSGDGGRR